MLHISLSRLQPFAFCFMLHFQFYNLDAMDSSVLSKFQFRIVFCISKSILCWFKFCLYVCVKASKFSNFKHMNMNDVNDISYYMLRKKLIFSHSRLHSITLKVHAINDLTMALQSKVCQRITLEKKIVWHF